MSEPAEATIDQVRDQLFTCIKERDRLKKELAKAEKDIETLLFAFDRSRLEIRKAQAIAFLIDHDRAALSSNAQPGLYGAMEMALRILNEAEIKMDRMPF